MKSKVNMLEESNNQRLYKWKKNPVGQRVSYNWNRYLNRIGYQHNWRFAPASTFNLSIQEWVKKKFKYVNYVRAYYRNYNFFDSRTGIRIGQDYKTKSPTYIVDADKKAPYRTDYVKNEDDLNFYGEWDYSLSQQSPNSVNGFVFTFADMTNQFIPQDIQNKYRYNVYADIDTNNETKPEGEVSLTHGEYRDFLNNMINSSAFRTYIKTKTEEMYNNYLHGVMSGYGSTIWSFHGYALNNKKEYFFDDEKPQWFSQNMNNKYYYYTNYQNYLTTKYISDTYTNWGREFYYKEDYFIHTLLSPKSSSTCNINKAIDWPMYRVNSNGDRELDAAFYNKSTYRGMFHVSDKYDIRGNASKDYTNVSRTGYTDFKKPDLSGYRNERRKQTNFNINSIKIEWTGGVYIKYNSDMATVNSATKQNGKWYGDDGYPLLMRGRGSPIIVPIFRIIVPTQLFFTTKAGFTSRQALMDLFTAGVYSDSYQGIMTKEEALDRGFVWDSSYTQKEYDDTFEPEYFAARAEVEFHTNEEWEYKKVGIPIYNVGIYPYFEVIVPSHKRYNISTHQLINTINEPTIAKIPIIDKSLMSFPSGYAHGDEGEAQAFQTAASRYSPTIWIDENNPNVVCEAESFRVYTFYRTVTNTIDDYYPNGDYKYQEEGFSYIESLEKKNSWSSYPTWKTNFIRRDGFYFYQFVGDTEIVIDSEDLGIVTSLVRTDYPDNDYGVDGYFYRFHSTKLEQFYPIRESVQQYVTSTYAYSHPLNGLQMVENELYWFELVSNRKYVNNSSYKFTWGANMLVGNVEYNKTINTNSEFPFAGLGGASIRFTVKNSYATVIKYLNKLVEYQVEFGDSNTYYSKGIFKIAEVSAKTEDTTEIVAYDLMTVFDVEAQNVLDKLEYPITIRKLLEIICAYCEVDYLHKNFYNHDMYLLQPIDPTVLNKDTYTFADVLRWISEIIPAVISFDNDGALQVKEIRYDGSAWGATTTDAKDMTIEPYPTIVPTCIIYKNFKFGNMEMDKEDEYWDLSENLVIDEENFNQWVRNTQNVVFSLHEFNLMKQEAHKVSVPMNVDIGDFWINSSKMTNSVAENYGLGIITEIRYDNSGATIITNGKDRVKTQDKKKLDVERTKDILDNIFAQYKSVFINNVNFYDGDTIYKSFPVNKELSIDEALISGINGDLEATEGGPLNQVIIDCSNAIVKFLNGDSVGFVQLINSGTYYGNPNVDLKLASGWTRAEVVETNGKKNLKVQVMEVNA